VSKSAELVSFIYLILNLVIELDKEGTRPQ